MYIFKEVFIILMRASFSTHKYVNGIRDTVLTKLKYYVTRDLRDTPNMDAY